MHCPDRSVPTPVTDSDDDRPILGHGNGFAKLHAHDGAGLAGGRRYDRGHNRSVARDARGVRTRNTQIAGQVRQDNWGAARIFLSSISQLLRHESVDVPHTSYRPCGATVQYVDVSLSARVG
jgi:hypothetical protein